MSLNQLLFSLLTVFGLSVGQVLFKLAARDIVFTPMGVVHSVLNPKLILALFVYMLATGMWLYVLKQVPLRVAYPYAALAFVFVPVMGKFILGEGLYWNTFLGALFIFVGVWISSWK